MTATSTSIYGTVNAAVTASDTFTISFADPCLDSANFVITNPGQTASLSDSYTGTAVTLSYNTITIAPPACTLTVTCSSVSPDAGTNSIPCQEIVADEATWTFAEADYTGRLIDPDSYVVTYDINVEGTS